MAHYSVITETEGVCHARLVSFDGPVADTPPDSVILIRGVRRWTGSYSDPQLVELLGRALDECFHLARGDQTRHLPAAARSSRK